MNRLVSKSFTLLALALGFATAATAATPVAVFESDDLNGGTVGGYTLTLNGNAYADGSITIGPSATKGVSLTSSTTWAGGSDGITAIVKYSSLTAGEGSKLIGTFKLGDKADCVGVRMNSDGGSDGFYAGNDWTTTKGTKGVAIPAADTVFMGFKDSEYTKLYGTNDGGTRGAKLLYYGEGLREGGKTVGGLITIGSSDNNKDVATNMVITSIAIYKGFMSSAEMAAFKFPSEITEYTTTSPVSGSVSWSQIAFDNTWTSSDAAKANITLAGDATITLPADFRAHTITFTGDYDVTFVSTDTFAPIGTITGAKSITRTIPVGYAGALTVPAGQTYTLTGAATSDATNEYTQVFTVNGVLETTGNVKLSGNNTINGQGAQLVVKSGTALLKFAGTGINNYGELVVGKGARAVALSTDAGNYNGANWKIRVYGTLDMSDKRWTIKGSNTALCLHGDGRVIGLGDNNGAIDLWSNITAASDAGTANTPSIEAPIKWTSGDATVDVTDGVTLTLAAQPKSNQSKFKKTGSGTLVLAEPQRLGGAIAVNAGTVEFACTNAITGTATVAADATLRISDGVYDLASYSIAGSLALAGGTVTVPSSATYSVNQTGGTLKVSVTDTEWSQGVTLGSNFNVLGNVTFIHGTSEVVGAGKTLAPQGITWIGGATGDWGVAANWQGNLIPTATDVVILETAGVNITVASTDVGPAGILVKANATLTGTLTSFGPATLSDGVTLTVNGAGAIAGVTGGALVKDGAGELAISANAAGFCLADVVVAVNGGAINNPSGNYRNLDITLAAGTTIKRNGWATCTGTLTVTCEDDVTAFANTGNANNSLKLQGLSSFVKKGAGTLTLRAALENTTVDIRAGKLVLHNQVNQSSELTVGGDGDFGFTSTTQVQLGWLSNFTNAVTGAGTLVCGNALPTQAKILANIQNAEVWTGMVAFDGLTGLAGFNPNDYGNTNSTIRFTGCDGYFIRSDGNEPHTFDPTIDLVNGTGNKAYGFKVTNGWSGDIIEFRKLTGAGKYLMAKPSGWPTRRHFFPDVSGFTGTFEMVTTGNASSIFIGRSRAGYVENGDKYSHNIMISSTIAAAITVRNEVGKIVIDENAEVTLPDNRKWYSVNDNLIKVLGTLRSTKVAQVSSVYTNRIEVAAGGVLEMVTSADQNDATGVAYTNLHGTGTVKLTGSGYHALPADPTLLWANTLSVVNEQPGGMILTGNNAEQPVVYTIGTFSGSKDIRVDYVNVANSRSLRVIQSADSEWSGRVQPCNSEVDRFHTLYVAGADGATAKTLTISGTNFDSRCPNILNVEATGSVNLTGNWVGDVVVAGELKGSGSAKGTITYQDGTTIRYTPDETLTCNTLAKADGAIVTVTADPADLAGQSKVKVLGWTVKPANVTFALDPALGGSWRVSVKNDGLYLTKQGFALILR